MLTKQFFEKFSTVCFSFFNVERMGNMPWKHTAKEMEKMTVKESIEAFIKKGNGTLKGLVLIAIVIAIGIAIFILTPAPVEQVQTQEDRITLTPTSTQMEVGEKIQVTATIPSDLYLEWLVDDPKLGSMKKASNEEVIFTAIKNGTVKITATAPNTPYKDDIEIEIFTRPKMEIRVLADSLLETNQLYKYTITYTDDSVSINETYLVDELGNRVDALFPQNMLRLERGGTYLLKITGVTYKGTPIEAETSFSVLPKIEAVSGKPATINLVSLAPSDIQAIEVFMKENLGLNVDLLKISKEGKLVKDVDRSFVAILFIRDNNEERVWMRTEVNTFDYYPEGQKSFRTERIGSSKDGYIWTIGVDISPYTQQISCVMAFPSKGGYHLSNKGYLTSGSGYSDSGGSTGGGGGKKPSPDIPPDDPGVPSPPPEDGGGGKPSPDIPPDDPGTPSPPPEDDGGGEQSPPPDDDPGNSSPPEGNGGGQSPDVPPDDPGMD